MTKEHSCWQAECQGSGQTNGLIFSVAVEYDSSQRPWTETPSGRECLGDSWRREASMIALNDIGDDVFDPVHGEAKVQELVDKLMALNHKHVYQVGSFNGVPAIQICSVDGRRLDININADGHAEIKASEKSLSNKYEIKGHGANSGWHVHENLVPHFQIKTVAPRFKGMGF